MQIAVAHDYFTQIGGAERVAAELVRMLPGCTLHSTVALPECMPQNIAGIDVRTTWMQHLPRIRDHYRLYFLLYPFAVGSLKLDNYDLVISSSSGYAKGVRTSRDSIHVCYCHTPMRWAWAFDDYSAREAMGPLMRCLLSHVIRGLRHWDVGASRQPDHFVANSKAVAARIHTAYGRTAEVIYPPIDISRFHPCSGHEDYYLVVSRLVSYKRIDLAVDACTALNRRLVIIGDGPDRPRLEARAGSSVSFLGRLEDRDVEYFASRCSALLFPGEEDFGMVPIEVAAAGRPTIAFRAGGAVETIIEGETGVFFDRQCPEDLARAINYSEQQKWSSELLRRHAELFSIDVFRQSFHDFFERIGCPVGSRSKPSLTAVPAISFGNRSLGEARGYAPVRGY